MTYPTRRSLLVCALALFSGCSDSVVAPGESRDTPDALEPRYTLTPISTGYLELCKEAGGGIASNAVFEFTVTQTGVVRTVSLSVGECISFGVPRERSALSKGAFKSRPELALLLVPEGSGLQVDGASLSAAQLQAILEAPANGSASVDVGGNTLLLNLAQQLIAAELNVLRGVQPTGPIAAAITTAGAGIQVAVPGPGQLSITTTLSQSQMSALVDLLSRFNGGKIKTAATPPQAQLTIVETIPTDVLVSITCDPAASCTGADEATGSVTASVGVDDTTRVTYLNRHRTLGSLRLCKVAGTGIEPGTSFSFNVTTAGTVAVAADEDCLVIPLSEDSGDFDERYGIDELGCAPNCAGQDQGFAVSSITCEPAGRCGSPSPGAGNIRVAIAAGEFTDVTYTNRSLVGTLRICKTAGSGIETGREFTFDVEGVTDDVAVAAGDCVDLSLREDYDGASDQRYGIFEHGCGELCFGDDEGFEVTSITCSPSTLCGSPSLSVGTVRAGVVGAGTTTVTFTNRSVLGTLRLCKAAGAGIDAGDPFDFIIYVPDIPERTVAAGDCTELTVPEGRGEYGDGWYRVNEFGCGPDCPGTDQGVGVQSIVCEPAANCRNASLPLGLVDFNIIATGTTTITYTNRSMIGTLRLCKVAGPGIQAGTVFSFNVGGDPVQVAAGNCADIPLREGNPGDSDGRYAVDEIGCGALCAGGDQGFIVTSITCDGNCTSTSTAVGTTRVAIVGAQVTTVTFTNAVPARE